MTKVKFNLVAIFGHPVFHGESAQVSAAIKNEEMAASLDAVSHLAVKRVFPPYKKETTHANLFYSLGNYILCGIWR
jgi:hypothetical protein